MTGVPPARIGATRVVHRGRGRRRPTWQPSDSLLEVRDGQPSPKLIPATDDPPEILDVIGEILEAERYRGALTIDLLDADGIARIGPALLFLDRMLKDGEGSGRRLPEKLRRHRLTARPPVVVGTGARRRAAENGALLRPLESPVVPKPFEIGDLLATITAALSVGAGETTAA